MTTFNSSVVELTSSTGQGSGAFITGNEILTAGHVADTVGNIETIRDGTLTFTGIVTQIMPGAPHGSTETATQVPYDFALVTLVSVSGEPTVTLSTAFTDGEAGTRVGYPGILVGGVPTSTGIQEIDPITLQLTQYAGLIVDNNPPFHGDSGGTILNASGNLIGVVSGAGAPYGYDAQITPASLAAITGWVAADASVTGLYHAALGRAPDLIGFSYYEAEGISTAAGQFLASAEFTTAHPGITFDQEVSLFYQQGLGRAASAAEMTWWDQTTNNPVALLVGIATSAEAAQHWGATLAVA